MPASRLFKKPPARPSRSNSGADGREDKQPTIKRRAAELLVAESLDGSTVREVLSQSEHAEAQ